MRWLAGIALTYMVAACYHPDTLDCTLSCTGATECAGGQTCTNGWCAGNGVSCTHEGQPITVDAAVGSGSGSDDDAANALCRQGCSKGTCMAGVCVIDCSEEGKCEMDVACPANLPCRVVCGNKSCTKKVLCGMSTSCEVECTGDGSCGDEIQCPAGDCNVTCSGTGSCKRRTKCANSCECDVTCSGPMSCMEASECPAAACRVGNGCSSVPSGCSSCS